MFLKNCSLSIAHNSVVFVGDGSTSSAVDYGEYEDIMVSERSVGKKKIPASLNWLVRCLLLQGKDPMLKRMKTAPGISYHEFLEFKDCLLHESDLQIEFYLALNISVYGSHVPRIKLVNRKDR